MTVLELYFGRAVKRRGPVTDAECSDFTNRVLAREFEGGFTEFDAEGGWRDPASGLVVRERTKIVRAALPAGEGARAAAAAKAQAAIDAYKAEFNQQSVGVTSARVCGAF
jgi:hypothetical protein